MESIDSQVGSLHTTHVSCVAQAEFDGPDVGCLQAVSCMCTRELPPRGRGSPLKEDISVG